MGPPQFKLVSRAFHWRGEPFVVFRAKRAKRQRHIGPGIVHDMNIERLAVGSFRRAADQGADARVPRIIKRERIPGTTAGASIAAVRGRSATSMRCRPGSAATIAHGC